MQQVFSPLSCQVGTRRTFEVFEGFWSVGRAGWQSLNKLEQGSQDRQGSAAPASIVVGIHQPGRHGVSAL